MEKLHGIGAPTDAPTTGGAVFLALQPWGLSLPGRGGWHNTGADPRGTARSAS